MANPGKRTIDRPWQRFGTASAENWNAAAAGHLYRRAAFSATERQLQQAVDEGLERTVDRLVAPIEPGHEFEGLSSRLARLAVASGEGEQLAAWWLYRMIHTPFPAWEKAALFWHGHFATSADKVQSLQLMYGQNNLLRRNAIGNFRELVHGIGRDPAMLIYLDSKSNRKTHPNENFARELMELFCLGLDNYEESDIKDLARCFTGWELRRDTFYFNDAQHDKGMKTLFGVRRNWSGKEAIDHVLSQPAAARFIAEKLMGFYVSDATSVDADLVEPLAATLRAHDFAIGPALRQIFMSRLFYSPSVLGQKIRSPIDVAIGTLRAVGGTTSTTQLARSLRPLGQRVFYPPNVKGWEGGKAWINTTTLIARANLLRSVATDSTTRFAGSPVETWFSEQPGGPRAAVNRLLKLLVAVDVPDRVRRELYDLAETATPYDVLHAIGILPEFHLT